MDDDRDPHKARRTPRHNHTQKAAENGLSRPAQAQESMPAQASISPGDTRLAGRGNSIVRVAMMQSMQQTVGNRALQRFLQQAAQSAQQQDDPNHASGAVAALPNRGAAVQRKPNIAAIQRSVAGSFPTKAGIFEMGMETKEGAVAGTGPSGLQGTIKFVPDKSAPYTNKLGLIQVVKLTDGGANNVNPVSLPTATGPQVRTGEDKAAGVEKGFFTDVLHNDPFITKKAKSAGDALGPYYPFSNKGDQIFGFKRSEDAGDIKATELFDFPGTTSTTSNLNFSFETVAHADDTGQNYGAVKWAFGLLAGKVVNETSSISDDASATWQAAVSKHRDFYVHEPVTFYFGFDADSLESGEAGKIDEFLDYLKQFPDVQVDLQGFADQRGNASHNRDLADRRTDAVAQGLIRKGVQAGRIQTRASAGASTGFTKDATTGQDKEANRRGNRRVTLTFLHTATPAGGTP